MQRIEYTTMDKSDWGDGPWASEPDKIQWEDAETGYPCLIVRNHMGTLCGYVGLNPGHPLYGCFYDNREPSLVHQKHCKPSPLVEGLEVHGGLTFSDGCSHGPESKGICHKPDPGEPDEAWWLGFDCGHAFDLSPGMIPLRKKWAAEDHKLVELQACIDSGPKALRDVYRDVPYVTAEVQSLAKQLKEVEKMK